MQPDTIVTEADKGTGETEAQKPHPPMPQNKTGLDDPAIQDFSWREILGQQAADKAKGFEKK